ncbi:hypothetical protein T4A_1299 [Trichinella pseudospiralis]|uniref:Uncharacterized protein n=1 Tax=Trichinella pseudospiralis TaxID=6337 RepID=A0A0V1F490_TRIPS|nr:hypothetical protein T4A_1299 [Trichinella pseudospiralis]
MLHVLTICVKLTCVSILITFLFFLWLTFCKSNETSWILTSNSFLDFLHVLQSFIYIDHLKIGQLSSYTHLTGFASRTE